MGGWGEFFRGLPARVLNFFHELGGPISIIVVFAFVVITTIWGGCPPSRPLQNHSVATNVIWGILIAFALLAAIFNPRSVPSESWNYIKRWGALIAFALLLVSPFFGGSCDSSAKAGSPVTWLGISVVLLALLLIVGWSLEVFTRPLKVMETDKVIATVRAMVLISYVFVLIALSAAFLPPFALGIDYYWNHKNQTKDQPTSAFYLAMVDSPVGLVRGCVHTRKETEWELACPTASSAPTPNATATAIPTPAAAATQGTTATANSAQAASTQATAEPEDTYAGQWLFKIGGSALRDDVNVPTLARSAQFYPVMVYGGLAVPWYFVMLAIMGAAVSMARRVPEYQRDVHVPEPGDDGKTSGASAGAANPSPKPVDEGTNSAVVKSKTLTPVQVRELLVFQIMQVLSAPLIAITAYNAMMPTSRSTSVALAFVSGFASESVLLVISSIVEKIKPEAAAPEK